MRYGVYYNKETIGDVLLISFSEEKIPTKIVKHNDIVALFKDDELIGYNFLNISSVLKIKIKGQIPLLNEKMVDILNSMLKDAGFKELEYLKDSGFKVGKILTMEEHPDSEHLHVLTVDVGEEKPLDIVCGSYNAKVGLKVVVAMPYAFMPSGKEIIPNDVIGVRSNGMLCSGRELNIEGYENKKGLYILDDSFNVGEDFYKIK